MPNNIELGEPEINARIRKRGKFAVLFPFKAEGDEDDTQDIVEQNKAKRRKSSKPKFEAERQIPKGWAVDDGKGSHDSATPQTARSRALDLICSDEKKKELEVVLDQFHPQPFQKLLEDLTTFVPTVDPTEIPQFPGHRMRCADYLQVANGKRRTGKTTLWRNWIPWTGTMFPVSQLVPFSLLFSM